MHERFYFRFRFRARHYYDGDDNDGLSISTYLHRFTHLYYKKVPSPDIISELNKKNEK